MKTSILLISLLFQISGSLMGQFEKFNYIDSDVRKFRPIRTDSLRFNRPNFIFPRYFNIPKIRNFNRFDLLIDSSIHGHDTLRQSSGFIVVEEYPRSSRYYGYMRNLVPDTRGKLKIIKPDTTIRYYLIIKDPIRQPWLNTIGLDEDCKFFTTPNKEDFMWHAVSSLKSHVALHPKHRPTPIIPPLVSLARRTMW